ncbi:phage gp6-like head-tail connector protein [Tardiphaga sp. vice304]|uniref:head-tail connector protein n=1 Tax=Tardiphaga sp. vice304 TaxID=2592817 RepID=UPI001162790E|nr:head-tail connector protein [Tardiphaga sp. vice304]QDM27570.1 phage gp6-like head-tail connector protein [Tardiphaga sp. vice304]
MTISLADLKAHLNIASDDDDDLLESKLTAASEWIARYTGVPVDAPDTPAPFDEATRQLAAHLFENREATLVGVTAQALPFGFLDLLNPYREWAF